MPWTKNKTFYVLITVIVILLGLTWFIKPQVFTLKKAQPQALPLSTSFEKRWLPFYLDQRIQQGENRPSWEQRIVKKNKALWGFWLTHMLGLQPETAYSLLINPPVDSLITDVTQYWNSEQTSVRNAKTSLFEVLSRYHSLQKITRKYHLHLHAVQDDSIPEERGSTNEMPLKVVAMVGLFQYQTALTDSCIWIGLDMFMNPNYRYYPSVQHLYQYQRRRTDPRYLPVAVARTLAEDWVNQNLRTGRQTNLTLLDQIVMNGQVLACLRWMLPDVHDSLLLGYSSMQWDWITKNQGEVWKDLVRKDLLYSADPAVINRFLSDGPFTSGYPTQSPPAIGLYLGDIIVQKWLHSLQQTKASPPWDLIFHYKDYDTSQILKNSGYKGRI
jgi:hypothetical protein